MRMVSTRIDSGIFFIFCIYSEKSKHLIVLQHRPALSKDWCIHDCKPFKIMNITLALDLTYFIYYIFNMVSTIKEKLTLQIYQ